MVGLDWAGLSPLRVGWDPTRTKSCELDIHFLHLAPYPATRAHGLTAGEGGIVVRFRKKHKGRANVVRTRRKRTHGALHRLHT